MGKRNLLGVERSRFWKSKTALDLVLDLWERGSWPMLRSILLWRLFGGGRKAPQPPMDLAVASQPWLPRVEPLQYDTAIVPKVIFQTWKVRQPLPANYHYWSQSFAAHNPGHQHILWDDADNRDFIARDFPWFLSCYDSFPREIFRADMVRACFLYRFGGLYVDMDTECLRPVDEALGEGDVILGTMGSDQGFNHAIPNAIMASKPRQLFWLLAIANAIERAGLCSTPDDFLRRPEYFTASILIYDCVTQYESMSEQEVRAYVDHRLPKSAPVEDAVAGRVNLLPSHVWYPINWNNLWQQRFRRDLLKSKKVLTPERVKALFPASHMVSYWTHSW
jgi:hypothetical protein